MFTETKVSCHTQMTTNSEKKVSVNNKRVIKVQSAGRTELTEAIMPAKLQASAFSPSFVY